MNRHKHEEISIVSEVDTPIALADAHPQCNVGNEPASRAYGHQPCGQDAIWAFRTHEGMGDHPTGTCPTIALVCDHHLEQLRDGAEHNLSSGRRSGKLLHCSNCETRIRNLEDVMWGIERIRS